MNASKAIPKLVHKIIFFSSAGLILSAAWATLPKLRAEIKAKLPNFISPIMVSNAHITCARDRAHNANPDSSSEARDLVWRETIIYLKNLAYSMTKTDQFCRNSDLAAYETGRPGISRPRTMCLMDRQDTRNMANQIYAILEN